MQRVYECLPAVKPSKASLRSSVAIVGCGNYFSNIAFYLSRSGIGISASWILILIRLHLWLSIIMRVITHVTLKIFLMTTCRTCLYCLQSCQSR